MSYRADLYGLLAEIFAKPPNWMSLPGSEWPLFDTVAGLVNEFEAAHHHLDQLASIPPEEHRLRKERYIAVFATGRPRYWLYESAALTGKILGPQTFEVARLYREAKLDIVGAELPDHISLELAFLSHLAGSSWERRFLEHHGKWMIDLGRVLSCSGDEIYAPIGALLANWLESSLTPLPPLSKEGKMVRVPHLLRPDECTLCGFCVQVCPTRALMVLEDSIYTSLLFDAAKCIHCGKCEKVCEFQALKMSLPTIHDTKLQTLYQSLQVRCETCDKPIASQAEMNYIVSQIGRAAWQHLCPDCRPGLYIK